jgi:hypothetical protein
MLNFTLYLGTSGRRKHNKNSAINLGLCLALYALFPGADGCSYLRMAAR